MQHPGMGLPFSREIQKIVPQSADHIKVMIQNNCNLTN